MNDLFIFVLSGAFIGFMAGLAVGLAYIVFAPRCDAPKSKPPSPRVACHARQYSDQSHCELCGLTWDGSPFDPDRPDCAACRDTPHVSGIRESRNAYRCSVCDDPDSNLYLRCYRPDCADGR